MREILFRGKRMNGAGWVQGYLIKKPSPIQVGDGSPWFIEVPPKDPDDYGGISNVDPATVGQYTGLQDKNGKRIFEGDIVRDMDGTTYPVVWGGTGFYLRYDPPHAHGMEYELLPLCNYWHAHGPIIEIIGNIHDNPELMDGGVEK